MGLMKAPNPQNGNWEGVDALALNDDKGERVTVARIKDTEKKLVDTIGVLAETVKEVNGVKPIDGKITLPVPDTSTLATKTELVTKAEKAEINATNLRVDALVINSGDANAEVTDARVSTTRNKEYPTVRNRFEDVEKDINIPMINTVKNSNFVTTANWLKTSSTLTVSNNEASFIATVQYGQIHQTMDFIIGNKYYVKADVKSSGSAFLSLYSTIATTTGSGVYEMLSGVQTATTTSRPITIGDNRASGWNAVSVKNVLIVDLTATFGAGKEPTKSEFEEILAYYDNSWFEVGNAFKAGKIVNKVKTLETEVVSKAAKTDLITTNESVETMKSKVKVIENDFSVPMVNTVKNSNFATVANWLRTGSTLTVSNNEASFVASVPYGQIYQDIAVIADHKYYVKAHVKTSAIAFFSFFSVVGSTVGTNEYEILSGVQTATASATRVTIGDNRTSGWDAVKVKNVMVVDLTATFGIGKEPTKDEFEKIISPYSNSWFENGNAFNAKRTVELLSTITNPLKKGNPRLIIVDKNGFGDYRTIKEAIANANASVTNEVTIVIMPGTYEERLKLGGQKYISLSGVNKRTCIIKDSSGLRANAPLEISGSIYVTNLTIYATFTDENVVIGNLGSYAVHIDYAGQGTAEFFNCNIISDCSSAVGAGTFGNQTIIFKQCYIKSNAKPNYMSAWCYALFLHGNATAGTMNQKYIIKDCEIRGVQDRVIRLSNVGSPFDVTFLNNLVWSDTQGKVDGVVFTEGTVNITLDSFGNNVATLNK